MTPEDESPAAAARRALRAARARARAEREGEEGALAERAEGERGPGERVEGERGPGERAEGERGPGERVEGERGPGERVEGERGPGERVEGERGLVERAERGEDASVRPATAPGSAPAVGAGRGAAPEGSGTDPSEGAVYIPGEAEHTGSGAVEAGEAARAALRETKPARRGDDEAAAALGGRGTGGTPETRTPETGKPEGGAARPQARPADVAREALRAARRQAARAEGEDAARGRTGAEEPRAWRGARAAAGSSGPSSARATASESGSAARAARLKAVQDMRRYLETAFRMPTWPDTEEEQHPDTADTTDTAGPDLTPAERTSPRTNPDPTTPHPTNPDPAPAPAPAPAHAESAPPPTPAAPPPHLPTTMATPHRDNELRRTFPEFGPREATAEGAPFAGTWWGNAWVDALEQGALDPKRLARGRGYADQGHVDAITVTPGLVLAYVRGSRPRPYRVQVRVRTLDDEDWARFLDAAADRPGHIAALLDKELPQSLADCGVPLLPGPGDLVPHCSCPDAGHPCKHAAALCYQTARLLDADPFVLLLLRGRGEQSLLDALSRRSAARAARAARDRQPETLPGVRATDALAPRELPPLPPPSPVPPHPEQPPVYPAAPGGPDPFALDQLATDAAARAHALLTTGRDPVGELTLWQDAVRLAAARPGSGLTAATRALYATLAAAVGRTPADLARAVAAWRQGGPDGLAVLEEPWDPPAGRFDRARPLLLAADLPAFRPWRNRLTHPRGHVQLRLGRDGLWYAYESEPGRDDWWPRGTPDLDPVGALTGLGTPDDV
ncbi:SWIM zinc finger family protein [Streptomyces sp. NPDC007251]|uniref:SWIM zinc finger family protein n=1 Tax=Streptomyces sp. NPDC007251 TaxID=3154483 RepID=UPI0033C6CB81